MALHAVRDVQNKALLFWYTVDTIKLSRGRGDTRAKQRERERGRGERQRGRERGEGKGDGNNYRCMEGLQQERS